MDDQDEEEGQSEPEENDSKQESGQEIISKDAENYDDNGVQDAGKWIILLRRGSIYRTASVKEKVKGTFCTGSPFIIYARDTFH